MRPLSIGRRWAAASFIRFAGAQRANVSMIFALAVIPFMIIAGLAIDIGRAILVRERLGHALDAAILAVGAAPHYTEAESQALGEQFFNANFATGPEGVSYDVQVTVIGDVVRMTAKADVPTTLLALINKDKMSLFQSAEAVRGGIDLELAMVLDNTGSMSGSKINALRDAAEAAVEILFAAGGSDPEAVKIALVPFAATVNVGQAHDGAWWLDPDGLSPLHSPTHNFSEPVNRWDLFDAVNRSWGGCVEARGAPYDLDDTPPSAANPATLFVPYFLPDAPGERLDANWGYSDDHSWLDDGDWEEVYEDNDDYDTYNEARQANVGKYYDGQSIWGAGPNTQCISQPVLPLTTSDSDLYDAIEDMQANGYTNIPNAAAWGIRVLSPAAPFTEGRDFDEEELVKAMILLTDGDNVLDGQGNHNFSAYGSYGYVAEGRLGTPTSNDGTLTDRLDDKTEEVCENARDLGIRVYTITFQVSSSSTQNMMRDCASTDDDGDPLYWDSPNSAELEQTFLAIARDLVDLRLTK